MIDLPNGITLNDGSIAGVPVGALLTEPGVSRKCLRCGHDQCPCCNDFCDLCFGIEVGDDGSTKRDGDYLVKYAGTPDEHRVHIDCARDGECKFDCDPHPQMALLFESVDKVFANVGGGLGITDDGRIWFSGKTHAQVQAELIERIQQSVKITKQAKHDKVVQLSLWESAFTALKPHERAAYISGMNHALTLVTWRTQEFEREGKKNSTRAGHEFIANLDADIKFMEGLRGK